MGNVRATVPRPFLQWHHILRWHYGDANGRDGVSNHQSLNLLNRLLRRSSKKTLNSASLAFVRGMHRWPVNYPSKGPVTWKMFPFDDVIRSCGWINSCVLLSVPYAPQNTFNITWWSDRGSRIRSKMNNGYFGSLNYVFRSSFWNWLIGWLANWLLYNTHS